MKISPSEETIDSKSSNRRFMKALGLAAALHAAIPLVDRHVGVVEDGENYAYMQKEAILAVLLEHPDEKEQYVKDLRTDLEKGLPIDLGNFYLKSEYLEGRSSQSRMRDSQQKLSEIEADLRGTMESDGMTGTLERILERTGNHEVSHSYLSSILLDHIGSCVARQKLTASLIQRLYPEARIAYQKVKLGSVPHTRALVQVDGKWYNSEDPSQPLNKEDLEGTVLFDQYDYVRDYAGEDTAKFSDLGFIKSGDRLPRTETKELYSDDYLSIPLPDGESWDYIKRIGNDYAQTSGQGGQGLVGTAANPTSIDPKGASYGGGRVSYRPIEIDLLTATDVEQNRRETQKILAQWKVVRQMGVSELKAEVKMTVPSLPDACADIFTIMLRKIYEIDFLHCSSHPLTGTLVCNVDKTKEDQLNRMLGEMEVQNRSLVEKCDDEEARDAVDEVELGLLLRRFGLPIEK